MNEMDRVLAANLEFYRAFTTRDMKAMEALWALRLPVSCLHPGWMILRERDAILRSWRDILGNPEAPRVMCHEEDAAIYGEAAIVTCEEDLGTSTLAATNAFAKEDGVWRMVHHQAGPLLMPDQTRRPDPRRLN
jgi:predicted nuclease with RNAse H fold